MQARMYLAVAILFLTGCVGTATVTAPAPKKNCPIPKIVCPPKLPSSSGVQLEVWKNKVGIQYTQCFQAWSVTRATLEDCSDR